jgi:predicted Zn-dependent protease
MDAMETYFNAIADAIGGRLADSEIFTAWFSAERSDFVRFNHARVRQAGTVRQIYLRLRLIHAERHGERTLSLAGDLSIDLPAIDGGVVALRESLTGLPADPYLLYSTEANSTRFVRKASVPPAEEAVEAISRAAAGHDLVGVYAAGPIYRGFANSLGQRNWHEVESFNFDWSLYLEADKAIKQSYGGFEWSAAELERRLAETAAQLPLLGLPARRLSPGEYRSYLAPAAVKEITDILSWGGFSSKARQTKQSALQRMTEPGASLHPAVTLCEDIEGGIAPRFQAEGFVKPPRVTLIEGGRMGDALVSPRTAREYGLAPNGANGQESPEALDMAGGDLDRSQVLSALDTGLYVSNLWYLNFSDRVAGRLTGMTRFACFWVESGKIVAPVEVMRFDDTLSRMLGDNLLHLTREREFFANASTYGERATDSARLPGVLLKDLRLTL